MAFFESGVQGLPSHYNQPLYVTTCIKDVELRHAMVDKRSLLNINHLSVLEVVVVSRDKIGKQLIEVLGFEGMSYDHINLKFIVLPIRTVNKFHVIGGHFPSYHVLLGRTWIRRHKAVPSTFHQFVKVLWKDKKIHICAINSPYQQDEARLPKAAFFDKLAEDVEVTPCLPQSTSLRVWEDLDEEELRPDALTSTSTQPPCPLKQQRRAAITNYLIKSRSHEKRFTYIMADHLHLITGLSPTTLNVLQVKKFIAMVIILSLLPLKTA